MLLSKFRMSPSDFLIDAAIQHFRDTGVSVRAFIVPPQMWEELKKDPDTIQTGLSYMLDVEGFDVIASEFIGPCLIEDGNNTGVPLL